jgi:hypothetical protein
MKCLVIAVIIGATGIATGLKHICEQYQENIQ